MASRVNVKFVVILSTLLVLLAGGAGFLAVKVVFKSAEQLAAKGDVKLAEGDVVGAERLYSKAVNKEPYNPKFLLKWRTALESWTPDSDRGFTTEFYNTYMALHNQLAKADSMSHPDYQVEYVKLKYDVLSNSGFSRGAYESFANEINDFVKVNESAHPDDDSWFPLRRYRGIVRATIAANGFDLTADDQQQALDDLQTTLKKNPADYDALESLLQLLDQSARKAQERDEQTKSEKILAEARALLDTFVSNNGHDTLEGIEGWMLKTEKEYRQARIDAVAKLGSQAIDEINKIAAHYNDITQQIGQALLKLPADSITPSALRRLMALESQTDPTGSFATSSRVLEYARSKQPDNTKLTLIQADVLSANKDYDKAYALLQTINDKPRLPLGLEGMQLISQKTQATFQQVKIAIAALEKATTDEAKKAWLEKAQSARTALGEKISEESPSVKFLDARLAYATDDLYKAQQLVNKYNQMTDNNSQDGLWLAADISSKLKEPGTARIALNRILEINPKASTAHIALADIEYKLGRMEAARTHYLAALKSNPHNQVLIKRIGEIEKRLGMRKADNPVEEAILESRRTAAGSESQIADPAGAVKILEDALTRLGPNEQLYNELIRLQLRVGNIDEAKQIVTTALKSFPDNETLKRYDEGLKKGDTLEGMVEVILDQKDRSESEKWLAVYTIYQQAGKKDLAAQALSKAIAAEPENPAVIELQFNQALSNNDFEKAKTLAEKAKELDLDHAHGLSYQARLSMAQGNNDEALKALNEAVDLNPNNAALYRILASLQMRMGQTTDAVASFQHALDIRPNDMATVIEYCRSLASLGRYQEALDVAHKSEVYGRQNQRFMDILLNLESKVGDKEIALTKRRKILEIRPDDLNNRYALIGLLIDLGKWDEAHKLIDETKQLAPDSTYTTELEARWYAEQNQLENARRVFSKAIAQAAPEERMNRYIQLAQFMLKLNRADLAVIALDQGSRYQPKGDHTVDAMLADTLMINNRASEAYQAYKRIIDDKSDPDWTYTKRAAEALIRLKRFDEAEQLLSTIPDAQSDATAVLLRADAILEEGDVDRAISMLDNAVAKWPDDPRVWLKRADAFSKDEDSLGEALADINQALVVQPNLSSAYRQKAQILLKMGRDDDAINALREAVRLNPQLDELRAQLIVELIHRDRIDDAMQLADDWIKLHPQDIRLRNRIGEMFVQGGQYDQAIQIYEDAMSLQHQPKMVLRLVDLLMNAKPPRYADAERVFADAQEIVGSDPALLIARAKLFANTNRMEGAYNDCNLSFKIMSHNPNSLMFWYSSMKSVYPDTSALMGYLNSLASQPGGSEWAQLFKARALLADEATKSQGIALLASLSKSTRDVAVRYATLRAYAGTLYNDGNAQQAVQAWKEALTLQPDDAQVENNIAYALAADLNKPEEALEYAKLAASHDTKNVGILDTLGTVYIALNKPDKAIPPLKKAVDAAHNTVAEAQYMVRLAQAKLLAGDKQGAKDLVVEIEDLLDRGRKLDDQYTAILNQVREGLK